MYKGKKNKKTVIVIAGVLLVLLLAVLISQLGGKGKKTVEQDVDSVVSEAASEAEVPAVPEGVQGETGAQEETPVQEPQTIELTISAAGDCTLGKDPAAAYSTSLNSYYDKKGAAYFLSGVKDIFAADDLTIVNMEGTFTDSEAIVEKSYNFKADASYVNILKEGSVEAANLANNHSHDYSSEGYEDTIQTLDDAGIANFGYDRTASMEINGLKVTLLGYNLLSKREATIQEMKEAVSKAKVEGGNLVIVSFHWGIERQYTPQEYQTEAAHAAIDAGADLVLGHHPHVLQGIEKYNGKYICYSLGNFCFGGNKNPSDKDTMIFQQTFTFENGNLLDDDNINIIPCRLSSSTSKNDYQPTVLTGDEKDRVMQKILDMSDLS